MRAIVLTLLLCLSVPAFAADADAIANYAGTDREAFLARGAKQERALVIYTNIAVPDIEKLSAEFERRYGIKPQVWRSGPDKVLQRVLNEARAGRYDADVVHISTPEMEALQREGLLRPVASPHLADLRPEAA